MGYSTAARDVFIENRLNAARGGQAEAYYELGLAYSLGDHGVDIDLVEAHKWFNLAVIGGIERAKDDRAEIAADLSRLDIANAQRRARAWLDTMSIRVAA